MSLLLRYLILALLVMAPACPAGDLKPIALPAPDTEGGRPLMQSLKARRSAREFDARKLPLETLSSLLWAAQGVNRPDSGKHTAPSASNRQEIDIYVAVPEGLYLYQAAAHRLEPVSADDIRAQTGTQAYVPGAPLNLVYVADFARMGTQSAENKVFYSACDTGFISQNVYLYSASVGLATVVRGSVDRPALAKAMNLRPDQHITLAQSVGYPAVK